MNDRFNEWFENANFGQAIILLTIIFVFAFCWNSDMVFHHPIISVMGTIPGAAFIVSRIVYFRKNGIL